MAISTDQTSSPTFPAARAPEFHLVSRVSHRFVQAHTASATVPSAFAVKSRTRLPSPAGSSKTTAQSSW